MTMFALKFTKMHGIGNDYIYVHCPDGLDFDPCAVSRMLSPRHTSVGADGLVLMLPSETADYQMRMFNADGSEGGMCGNAIRCVGKYLYDHGIVCKTHMSIQTKTGIRHLEVYPDAHGKVISVKVEMGQALLEPKDVPHTMEKSMIAAPIITPWGTFSTTALMVGNPHAVIWAEDITTFPLGELGAYWQNNALFPERVNMEVAHLIDPTTIEMRVYERGSGETYACGTGASATVAAAVLCGYCQPNVPVTVRLIGGELIILCTPDLHIYMTGTATLVYDGMVELPNDIKLSERNENDDLS